MKAYIRNYDLFIKFLILSDSCLSVTIIKLKSLYIFYEIRTAIFSCLISEQNCHIFQKIVIFHYNRVVVSYGRETEL
jgi:hypothetical protein